MSLISSNPCRVCMPCFKVPRRQSLRRGIRGGHVGHVQRPLNHLVFEDLRYRDTSFNRNSAPLGPDSRPMPGALLHRFSSKFELFLVKLKRMKIIPRPSASGVGPCVLGVVGVCERLEFRVQDLMFRIESLRSLLFWVSHLYGESSRKSDSGILLLQHGNIFLGS